MSWTNDYIGLPYKINGRAREGLDCWGLVRLIYSELRDIELPSYAERYTHSLDEEGFQSAFGNEESRWNPVDELREFDVAWCRVAGVACHTGVILESGRMLHAMLGNDSCIVDISGPGWQRRVLQCYRHE